MELSSAVSVSSVEITASSVENLTPCAKKNSDKSIYVIYFTLFIQSLGMAIVISGIWPFLDKLDPTAGLSFYAFVSAANPMGQTLFSPILGYWANKTSSIRIPIIASLVMFCVSNGLYSSLDLVTSNVKYWMFAVRFLTGIAAANVAVCRNYVVKATTPDDRTRAMSLASLCEVSGFIVGSLLQLAVAPLGDGIKIFNTFQLSMYTAPALVSIFLGVVNMFFFMPSVFKDKNISAPTQAETNGKAAKVSRLSVLDYMMILSLIYCYFTVSLNFVILESLGTPISIDQFNFTKQEAIEVNTTLLAVGSMLACLIFIFLPRLCKAFKEIDVLVWGGLFALTLSKVIHIPMRLEARHLSNIYNYSTINGTIESEEVFGGSESLKFEMVRRLGFPEYIVGYFVGVMGYPIAITLVQSLYSKLLGDRKQGTWTGSLIASGAASGIFGSVVVVKCYATFGSTLFFSTVSAVMLCPLLVLLTLRSRMLANIQKH